MSYDDEEDLKEEDLEAEEEIDLASDVGDDALEEEIEDDDLFTEEDDLGEEFAGLDGSATDYL